VVMSPIAQGRPQRIVIDAAESQDETLVLARRQESVGVVTGLDEKNDIPAMTPTAARRISTKSNSAAQCQAIGVGREGNGCHGFRYRGERRRFVHAKDIARSPCYRSRPWHLNSSFCC